MSHNNKMNWQHLIELIVVLLTILGATIPLYMHTDNKMQASISSIREEARMFREEVRGFHNDIYLEMKDFHGRLCAIEERRRNND